MIDKFPDAEIVGIDMCENYVKLYLERTGRTAWVERIEKLPDELGTFDYILCVTVLMYLNLENLGKSISNLLAHLKPDGTLILIEPDSSGKPLQTGFGLLTFLINRVAGRDVETGGRCFRSKEMRRLFSLAGGQIVSEERLPFTSLFFLPMAFIGQLLSEGMSKRIYRVVSVFDALLGGLPLPSIYVAYLIRKK